MKALMLLIFTALGFTADAAFAMGLSGATEYWTNDRPLAERLTAGTVTDFVIVLCCIAGIYFRMRYLIQKRADQMLAKRTRRPAQPQAR